MYYAVLHSTNFVLYSTKLILCSIHTLTINEYDTWIENQNDKIDKINKEEWSPVLYRASITTVQFPSIANTTNIDTDF